MVLKDLLKISKPVNNSEMIYFLAQTLNNSGHCYYYILSWVHMTT